MRTSQAVMEKAGIKPRLKLGEKLPGGGVRSLGPVTVKLVSDKIVRKLDRENGEETEYMRYIVEHDGMEKQYDTRLKGKGSSDPSYLVEAMAVFSEGDEVVVEMKRAGARNYVEVHRVGEEPTHEDASQEAPDEDTIDIDEDDITG